MWWWSGEEEMAVKVYIEFLHIRTGDLMGNRNDLRNAIALGL